MCKGAKEQIVPEFSPSGGFLSLFILVLAVDLQHFSAKLIPTSTFTRDMGESVVFDYERVQGRRRFADSTTLIDTQSPNLSNSRSSFDSTRPK